MFQEEERPPCLLSSGCTKASRILLWHICLGCNNKSSSNDKKLKKVDSAIAVFRIQNKTAAELRIEIT